MTLEPEHVIGQADGAVDVAFTADGAAWFGVPADRDRDSFFDNEAKLGLLPSTAPIGATTRLSMDWPVTPVNAVEVAPDGTLWVATDQGIDVYNEELDNFAPANP